MMQETYVHKLSESIKNWSTLVEFRKSSTSGPNQGVQSGPNEVVCDDSSADATSQDLLQIHRPVKVKVAHVASAGSLRFIMNPEIWLTGSQGCVAFVIVIVKTVLE